MIFKLPHMKAQYDELPQILKDICEEFDSLSNSFGIEPVVTRVSDPVEGESGVHPLKRAVDFRDQHDGRFLYTTEQRDIFLERIESIYKRNDGKPTIVYHSFNGAPFHFHVQIAFGLHVYAKEIRSKYKDGKTNK